MAMMHWASKADAADVVGKVAGIMPPAPLLVAYALFAGAFIALFQLVVEDSLSALLTVAEMTQCLSVGLLCCQVIVSGSVQGISAQMVQMDALALCFRLSSTLWLNGYLPVDASGDYVFQAVDITSVIMLLWLLHQLLQVKRNTYQEEADTFNIIPAIAGAIVLAFLFHADMNNRPFFDACWLASLLLRTVSVIPQLWLIMFTGGKVEPLTAHHIATMALGRAVAGIFMWHARHDITCLPWFDSEINHAVIIILGAQLLHMLLLGDFAYIYIKAVMTQGLGCRIELEGLCNFV
mmetsp:Transcript_13293/g.35638  ORF Transcript_13293/g.35638 Transcript_13293/m.35638 type:complete len:293 (-) Transcript_13293:105-983(-)